MEKSLSFGCTTPASSWLMSRSLSSRLDITTTVLSRRLISFEAAGSETSSASMPCNKLMV